MVDESNTGAAVVVATGTRATTNSTVRLTSALLAVIKSKQQIRTALDAEQMAHHAAQHHLSALQSEVQRLEGELNAIRASAFWRMTAPVRKVLTRFPALRRARVAPSSRSIHASLGIDLCSVLHCRSPPRCRYALRRSRRPEICCMTPASPSPCHGLGL